MSLGVTVWCLAFFILALQISISLKQIVRELRRINATSR
jgi:hypothetical protein